MPRGGHNRTSLAQKRLAATTRQDRVRVVRVDLKAPDPSRGIRPPLWLKPVAVAKWAELAPTLKRRGILTDLSRDLLASACMHWEMMVRCYHRVSRDGPVVKNARGRWVKHPVLQVLRENSAALRDCLSRMGMTPTDMGKLSGIEEPDQDEGFFESARRR